MVCQGEKYLSLALAMGDLRAVMEEVEHGAASPPAVVQSVS